MGAEITVHRKPQIMIILKYLSIKGSKSMQKGQSTDQVASNNFKFMI